MERKALKPMDGMREAFEKWAKTFPNYIDITRFENGYSDSDTNYAWVAWQAALAQPAQEPVAWKYDWYCDGKLITGWIAHSESEIPKSMAFNIRPLYTVPPQPAQEPVDWEQIYWDMVNAMLRDKLRAQPAQGPVAVVAVNQSGGIRMEYQDGSAFDISKHVGQRFYTTPPQPAQEPVAWMVYTLDGASVCVTDNPADFTPEHRALPLYTIPPQRSWVGLTEKEKKEIYRLSVYVEGAISLTEAKLKEKNNG